MRNGVSDGFRLTHRGKGLFLKFKMHVTWRIPWVTKYLNHLY
jgi:hypothetical protein